MHHHLKVLLLVLISGPLFASGDDLTAEAEAEANADAAASAVAELIGGDQISKHTSISLAQSLGDVDLGRAAECVITEQYGIIIWQRQNWEYDPWCIARILDGQGKHYEAAQMRCFHKPTSKLYGDRCIETLTFDPPPEPPPAALEDPRAFKYLEAEEVLHDEQQEEMESIESRLARIEAGNRAAARAAQQRRDYAQQTLDKVRNHDPEK